MRCGTGRPGWPASPRAAGARVDWAGAALLIASLGLANLALLRGAGQSTTLTLTQCCLAAVTFAAFVLVQLSTDAPTLDLSLFAVRPFTGAVLTIGATVYFVQYFQEVLDLTPTQSGLMLVPRALAQMGGGMLGGRLQARFAPGLIIAAADYAGKAVAAIWLGVVAGPAANPCVRGGRCVRRAVHRRDPGGRHDRGRADHDHPE